MRANPSLQPTGNGFKFVFLGTPHPQHDIRAAKSDKLDHIELAKPVASVQDFAAIVVPKGVPSSLQGQPYYGTT